MSRGARCLVWLMPLVGSSKSTASAEESADLQMSTIYLDNVELLTNHSNVVSVPWPTLETAFRYPNNSDIAHYDGLDWTKPFPGNPITGFSTHLRIADEIPLPSNVTKEDARTNVAALSHGIPPSMMGTDGLPKPMDDSWYVCRHYYVSVQPDPTQDVAHDCSFLPTACIDALKSSIVENWGYYQNNSFPGNFHYMCSGFAEDAPASCTDSLGRVRPVVYGFNQSYFEDPIGAQAIAVDEVVQYSWMLGTGSGGPHNQTSYQAAANRTYLVATVYGHSWLVTDPGPVKAVAELACLRPKWNEWNPPSTSTTTTPGSGASDTPDSNTSGTAPSKASSAASSHSTLACKKQMVLSLLILCISLSRYSLV